MKIDAIELFLLGDSFVLRITTDDGISGVGQSGCWGYPTAVKSVIEHFEQYLVGQDPRRIEHHWQHLYRMGAFRGNILGGAISASTSHSGTSRVSTCRHRCGSCWVATAGTVYACI